MLWSRQPMSLTQVNVLRLIAVFIGFGVLAAAAVYWLLMLPMASRAAGDFGELLAMSAETWAELPPSTRPAFERHLLAQHGILLTDRPTGPLTAAHQGPYLQQLEAAVSQHFSRHIVVSSSQRDGKDWHWLVLPAGARDVWLGFPHDRVGAQPVVTILVIAIVGLGMAIISAWWLAKRTVAPLRRLNDAAITLGRGERPALLPTTGPRELAELAQTINALARQVHELLDGRTTLLAGLSHDLRTPLARMMLAVEMLQRRPDPEWTRKLEANIQQMSSLVSEMLDLARGLGREPSREIDLAELLTELTRNSREAGGDVVANIQPALVQAPLVALRRVLENLLSNALRYGGGEPVRVETRTDGAAIRIGILDRGPGIPADQLEAVFRPFHRVESSRSISTGGSGLGLAIVRQLAQANGWQVTLENRADGGLAAWVAMPLPADPDPQQSR